MIFSFRVFCLSLPLLLMSFFLIAFRRMEFIPYDILTSVIPTCHVCVLLSRFR